MEHQKKSVAKVSEDNRISKSILFPLTGLLRLTSVPISRDVTTATKLWAAFWLAICAQAHFYNFYGLVSSKLVQETNNTTDYKKNILDYLMIASSFNSMILDLATYLLLLVKLGSFLDSLWERCKPIDRDLNYRNMKCVTWLSIISACYLSMTVYLNFLFRIITVFERNGSINGHTLQSAIRNFTNRWFHAAVVWIFGLCARTLTTYCDMTLEDLTRNELLVCPRSQTDDSITRRIESIKKLASIANWMTNELGVMLFANFFSSMIFMLTFALMAITHTTERQEQVSLTEFIWDLTDIFDAFLRMCIIAHSADHLRSIGVRSVPVLRQLRDSCLDITKRRKMTIFIVELAGVAQDGKIAGPLLGIVDIGKSNILQTIHTVFTYFIIIYQAFQM